jgi:predicted nucleic acid-binding Zn ribbon protein
MIEKISFFARRWIASWMQQRRRRKKPFYILFSFLSLLCVYTLLQLFLSIKKSKTLNLSLSVKRRRSRRRRVCAPFVCACACVFFLKYFWKVPLDFFGGISDENFSQNRETIFSFPRRGREERRRRHVIFSFSFFFLFSLLVLLSLDSHFRWK